MNEFPKKRRPTRERAAKRAGERFDANRLTPEEHRLLADCERRRDGFDRALEQSNILYHKHTCPVCGFPTLDERGMYEVCVVCLWEDDGGEKDPTVVRPPNYSSMMAERINIAGMLAAFERTHAIVDSLDAVVRCIDEFKERRRRGEVEAVRDFEANLKQILPTTLRGER